MEKLKELVGRKVVEYIQDGMVVGLGSGSTAACAIRSLGEKVAQGLSIRAISTSYAASRLARECGIELVTLEEEPVIDLTFDGADEVDPQLDLIKGLGGALLREKVIASASTREIILVDHSKMVDRLGTRTPLPVEVVPLAWSLVQRNFVARGLKPELRVEEDEPFVTDNGNYIIHCTFPEGIDDPVETDRWINDIPGVVENGLFVGYTDVVLVAEESGECRTIEKN